MKHEYDFLVVGAGLFGATFACMAKQHGKKCLVIDKRSHLGGNVYCEDAEGITVHKYGPHIFHTHDEKVWNFVNRFVSFNRFTLNTIANYKGKLYNLPFNMYTFYQMWGVTQPEEARRIIESQRREAVMENPANLEEQAICLVGRDVYATLIKGIQRNSGDVRVRNCLHRLSSVYPCGLRSTTIILTTGIKVYRWEGTMY